jgi:hypothetical protein
VRRTLRTRFPLLTSRFLAQPIRLPRPAVTGYVDLSSVPVGITDTRQWWRVPVLGHHLLIAGASGAGKGSVLWSLIAGLLVELVHQAATETALALLGDKTLRFGDQIDIKVITTPSGKHGNDRQMSGRQIAGYLAKYVTKSVADFGIAVRRLSTAAIDQLDVADHIREILRTIVTISAEAGYTEMISWIHTLGYRGHVVSKSRQFSTTLTALRERRRAWRKSETHDALSAIAASRIPQPSSWQFQRLGHVSLGDRVLVVSAARRAQEARIAARQAANEGAVADESVPPRRRRGVSPSGNRLLGRLLRADVVRNVATQRRPDEQSTLEGR